MATPVSVDSKVITSHRVIPRLMEAFIAALLVVGCSATYNGERLYWKAQQHSHAIEKDPNKATPEQFSNAIQAYERVIRETPTTSWAARAQLSIGSLYALEKQYDKAREAYLLVLQNYNQYREYCLAARLATARTYEAEQKWPEAVAVYEELSDYFPWTVVGLEAPLHIARTYEQRKQPEEATSTYERAVRLYTRMIPNAPTPEHAAQVKGYLALAYQRLSKWDDAIGVLQDLAKVPSGVNRPLVLLTLGSIYQTKIHDLNRAKELYSELIQEFPDHPFGRIARAQLLQLGGALPSQQSIASKTSPVSSTEVPLDFSAAPTTPQ